MRPLLEAGQDNDVVGEAGTVADAPALIPAAKPDVAILDVRLPDGSGVEVCQEIRSTTLAIACVMLTSYADDEALIASIMAGYAKAGKWTRGWPASRRRSGGSLI